MNDLIELCEWFNEEHQKQKKKWFWYLRPSTDRLMKDWEHAMFLLQKYKD